MKALTVRQPWASLIAADALAAAVLGVVAAAVIRQETRR